MKGTGDELILRTERANPMMGAEPRGAKRQRAKRAASIQSLRQRTDSGSAAVGSKINRARDDGSGDPELSSPTAMRLDWSSFREEALAAADAARRELAGHMPELQREWGDFLKPHPWEWLVTVTFADSVHPEQAEKRLRRWIAAIERKTSRRLIFVAVAERQARGALHFHVLMNGVKATEPTWAMAMWERIGGGFARIAPYDRARGGAFYVVKDIVRSADVTVSDVWFD